MSALDAALVSGRREAEARMRDQVRVYRQGPDIFDRVTGQTTAGQQVDLYVGPARVKPVHRLNSDVEVGERQVAMRRYEVHLPWSTVLQGGARVLPGDRVEVTVSADARLVGALLWVSGAEFGSQSTAWRIGAEDRS